jgi:hypothetical protein
MREDYLSQETSVFFSNFLQITSGIPLNCRRGLCEHQVLRSTILQMERVRSANEAQFLTKQQHGKHKTLNVDPIMAGNHTYNMQNGFGGFSEYYRLRAISWIARMSLHADCWMYVISATSAKPSSLSFEMYDCSRTFTYKFLVRNPIH